MKEFVVYIVGVLLVLLNYSCVSHKKSIADKNNEKLVFPAPPEDAHIQFLTKITTEEDLKPVKESFFYKYVTGEETVINELSNPYGIKSTKGKVYIADIGLKAIVMMDLRTGKFENFKSSGISALNLPVNCEVDEHKNLFVVDGGRDEVLIFDQEKRHIGTIGDENLKPFDICCYDEKLFVTNLKGHTINVYENKPPYSFLYSFPEVETEEVSYLRQPKSISIRNNKVYIADWGNFDVKIFNVKGEFEKSIGRHGKGPGTFARPKGIGVDDEENIFAVDAAFENVQIFNNEGQLLLFFGGGYKGPGYMYMPSGVYVDDSNINYFKDYVKSGFELKYLIFVTNQHGPDKITVYGRVEKV
ncbi:6-bladed beta-propeller [Carboxylicivirga marina]|uniref:6-bladed beta-propeller n=1 Tax=Carboxylicivirga marina TaxID=2800988 RepID=UPI002596D5C8|nr:6-bladed beta-propeller [uncultured Carboxylicivirga sp.]